MHACAPYTSMFKLLSKNRILDLNRMVSLVKLGNEVDIPRACMPLNPHLLQKFLRLLPQFIPAPTLLSDFFPPSLFFDKVSRFFNKVLITIFFSGSSP